MQNYKNLGRDSGVSRYQIDQQSIIVEFSTGAAYEYTYASAGSYNIERMKQLAVDGQGLNSFINSNVKKKYSRKLR